MSLYRTVAEDGMTLRMPAGHKRVKTCVSAFRGAEDLPASEAGRNLSPRRLPAAATRRPRGLLMTALGSGVPHGMAIFGGDLYFVRGTTLYRMDDDAVIALGTVSDTDKHFFVFGERLYVYPDKLYVQAGEMVLRPMELDTGVLTGKTVFKGSTVTLPSGMTWSALGFAVGDCLRVVNRDDDMPAPEGYYRLVAISGRAATVAESFPVTYESIAQLRRVVPDLDGVCVSGDRVYGFAGKDVYVSAAGSALDFYSRSAATLRLASEGEITACTVWQGYVIFFKRESICKLLGTRPESFTLQERPAVGLAPTLAGTLCEVSGDLYFVAEGGVYRYRGQEPERISPVGDVRIERGIGGTDGVAYYAALRRGGSWKQFCYLPAEGTWFAEDVVQPCAMIRRRGFLCMQDADGYLWLTSSDGRETGCPSDEWQVRGPIRSAVVLPPDYDLQPGGCRLVGVSIRATGGTSSAMEVFAEYADGAAHKDATGKSEVSLGLTAGNMTDRLIRFPVTPHACDGVRLRLAMTGDWLIHSVIREYEV